MKNLKILNGKDLTLRKQTVLLYGAPGIGKTTALGALPGRTLIIDVDRGADVLLGNERVDIVRLSPDMGDMKEIMETLEKQCEYDNVCLDSLSELERGILAILGRGGRNGGAPELAHYNQVQFKMADTCRRLRALPANIVFTAWEEYKDVTALDGTKFTQTRPMMSGKTADQICGLCDIVGEIILSPKDGKRYIRLEAQATLVAKDRFFKRQFCELQDLLKEDKADA